jgi:hypothetical protein
MREQTIPLSSPLGNCQSSQNEATMGQAPTSKPSAQPEAPSRPYHRSSKRSSRRLLLPIHGSRREPRTMVQLILRQDWQKVLVRAKLFPHEIAQHVTMELYDLKLRLLPLHLACALDPPVAVVTLFLKLNPGAAMYPIKSVDNASLQNRKILRRPLRTLRKYKRLLQSSTKSLSSTNSGHSLPGLSRRRRSEPQSEKCARGPMHADAIEVPEQSLLHRHSAGRSMISKWRPYRHVEVSDSDESSFSGTTDHRDDESPKLNDLDNPSLVESYSSSSMASSSLADQKNVILQLSPSGGLSPFPVGSQETDSTTETLSQAATTLQSRLFGIQWDLTPLWESMANPASPDNSLLPIHVAALYQASPSVLKQLLEAHPMGAVNSVLGMLPIHIVCAGWRLEPIFEPPPPPPSSTTKKGSDGPPLQPFHHHHDRHPSRILEALALLREVLPESVRIRSGNHGMTPSEYISEAMEEGPQKQECLELLEPGKEVEEGLVDDTPLGPLDQLTEMASMNP